MTTYKRFEIAMQFNGSQIKMQINVENPRHAKQIARAKLSAMVQNATIDYVHLIG